MREHIEQPAPHVRPSGTALGQFRKDHKVYRVNAAETPDEPGVFLLRSAASGRLYLITVTRERETCSCVAGDYGIPCSHRAAVAEHLSARMRELSK